MPLDLLGPANAVGAVTTRPGESREYGATDTWFAPCTSPSARDGTQLQAVFLNALLDQLRYALRAAGIPLDNADASMLWQAMQAATSGIPFGVASGSPTSLLVEETFPPLRAPYGEGRVVLVGMPANLSIGTGAQLRFGLDEPGLIVRNDGSPVQSGDAPPLSLKLMAWRSGRWQLLAPGEAQFPQILGTATIYVDTLNGDDAADGRSTGTALKTVGEAQNRSTRFYQFGKPLLIKLVRSGIYPLPAAPPSLSGSLIIQGDPAAQDSYILQGSTGGSSASVIGSGGANLTLEGLTISNLTTGRYTAASSAGGRLTLNRVTLTSTQTLSVSHVYCTGPSTIEIGTNVIWASSAASMLSVRKGEIALTTNSASSVRNNPVWSDAAAVADGGGTLFVRGGSTMSGAATGPRYRVGVNAIIDAGGAGEEFFRGNQPGTQDNARSGFYIP